MGEGAELKTPASSHSSISMADWGGFLSLLLTVGMPAMLINQVRVMNMNEAVSTTEGFISSSRYCNRL